MWFILLLVGAFVMQPASCVSRTASTTLAATNFCFIFDCQNGFFGGLIQPCGSPLTSFDDILQDCPAPVVIPTP